MEFAFFNCRSCRESDFLNYATINIEYMNLNWPFGTAMLMTQMEIHNTTHPLNRIGANLSLRK